MIRKLFEGAMFAALVLVGWIWVVGWASNAFGQVGGSIMGNVYPVGAIPIAATATATAGTATATLAATPTGITYINGFEVTATNATAGASFTVTVAVSPTTVNNPATGLPVNTTIAGATLPLNYQYTVVTTGATVAGPQPLIVEFPTPLPAQVGVNTANNLAITVSATIGAGGTVSIIAHGFQITNP